MLGNYRYKLGKPNINQVNLVDSSLVRYTQFDRVYFKILPSKKKLGCHNQASQATLSCLDETLSPLCQEHQVASANKLKPNQSQKPLKNSQTLPSDFTDQGSNSSTNQQSHSSKAESSNSSSNNNLGSTRSNGQTVGAISSSNGNGLSGGDNGSGEDPNRDRKKKSDPVDKKDDVDEEDVNLYSDIESIEDENHPPEMLTKIEVNLTET